MKKSILMLSLVIMILFFLAPEAKTQLKSYYSGDAVVFNNQLYVASTNSGYLELFRLEGANLRRLIKVKPYQATFNTYGEFYDVKLWPEQGKLYIYAVSEFSLYKYELGANNQLNLVTERKNTFWEWYNRVDRFGDDLVTISEKGLSVWNTDIMDTVLSLPLVNKEAPYNIHARNNRYILNSKDNYLHVFDRESGQNISSIALNYKTNPGNRQAYQDESYNIYVVDDYYTKKFSLDGNLLGSFRHLDYSGYDVAASGHSDYIYFSNGLGVVKLKKSDMSLVSSRQTTSLGGPRGWAMGLKVVYLGGDKLVLFNNNNILIMDDRFGKLAEFVATEEDGPVAQENLYLNLDYNFGAPQASIKLNGGGYFPQEMLIVDFAGFKTSIQADIRGRFNTTLTVPALDPKRVDIKVSGETSGLHYSIAFNIH